VPVLSGDPNSVRASGCLGCSRRGGLSSAVSVVVGETWIPALEQRPECAVKRPRARLQQQVGAAFGPLHLLTLGKSLADDSVHCGLG
jgi:hypothetical protein